MTTIGILALGNADRTLVEGLIDPLKKTFGIPVEMRYTAVPVESFYDRTRSQYNSTAILQWLHRRYGGEAFEQSSARSHKTLAVIGYDLFIPILTFVFGEAELGGTSAVVSYNRLQNERYGLPPNKHLLLDRLRKEAVHELGHAFGLVHCHTHECVMHTSTYVEDIDLKSDRFCEECVEVLHNVLVAR